MTQIYMKGKPLECRLSLNPIWSVNTFTTSEFPTKIRCWNIAARWCLASQPHWEPPAKAEHVPPSWVFGCKSGCPKSVEPTNRHVMVCGSGRKQGGKGVYRTCVNLCWPVSFKDDENDDYYYHWHYYYYYRYYYCYCWFQRLVLSSFNGALICLFQSVHVFPAFSIHN